MSFAVVNPVASEVVSSLDLWKPDRLAELGRQYGDQGYEWIIQMLAMERTRMVAQDTYDHFEDQENVSKVRVQSNVADPGAGNPITFRLHSDFVDSDNRYGVRLNDTILFNNEVTGTVINIVAAGANIDITVDPNEVTDNIGALTAGEYVGLITNAFSEGSGQPDSLVDKVDVYDNDVQIIKETVEVTGSEMTNQTWLNASKAMGVGEGSSAWYNESWAKSEFRMLVKQAYALHFQKRSTNSIVDPDPNSSRNIKTTHGLIPTLRDRAYQMSVADNALTIEHFRTIDKELTRQLCYDPYVEGRFGIDRHHEAEEVLKSYFDNANIEHVKRVTDQFFGGDESLSATVDFQYVKIGGRNFCISRANEFNHPSLTMHADSKISDMATFIPLGKTKDGNGKARSRCSLVFKGLGGYSRKMEVWLDGTSGPGAKIGDVDTRKTYWRAHIGFEGHALNQAVLLYKP